MVTVTLQYETQDNMGSTVATFWKDIEMPAPPAQGLAFDDGDFVFTPNRTIQYSLGDKTYFARCVERNYEDMSDMFKKLGWTKAGK